jgi:PAS domain S-box-containing protein
VTGLSVPKATSPLLATPAEEELAALLTRERERLSVALRAGRMGIYEWRVGAETVWWSPETYAVYGVDEATFRPTLEAFTALIHPDHREELWRRTQHALAEGADFEYEYRIVCPDGSERWVANRSQAGRGPTGVVERLTGVASDVTERKLEEQRLAILIAAIDDHLVVYDRAWRYTFVNEAASRVLGVPAEALLGQCIWELYPAAVGNAYYRELHRALETQQVVHQEHYYAPFDRWFENHMYPSPDGVTVLATDITARKRVEAALREREEALEDAARRKDEFLAMLAHELRNPLAAITNAVQLLHSAPADPTTVKAHGVLDRQVRHMVRQVDDLLDVSRISRGTIEIQREPVDLAQLVRDAVPVPSSTSRAETPYVELASTAGPIVVIGDPVRLAQVVGNLLNNAMKFTEPGGRITITLDVTAQTAELRVTDTGVGIPAEALHRIFDAFVQLEHSRQRTRGGLGLGLSLVQRIVALHDGEVYAQSEGPGRGSTFVVRLPTYGGDVSAGSQ